MTEAGQKAQDARGRAHVLNGFGAAAVEFVRALERNRERIALDEGLTASELRALFHIGSVVSVTPKELALRFGMTTGAITFISRRLVERGLVQRVEHPNDRRSLYLELTPLAHDKLETIHREFESMVEESTDFLTPEQRIEFTHALSTAAKEIDARAPIDDRRQPGPPHRLL